MITTDTAPTGTWDTQALARLRAHIHAEREILSDYEVAAKESDEPDVRYLVGLIIEDEKRHHRVFEEMANSLEAAIEWRNAGPVVPPVSQSRSEEVQELTRHFLRLEREDRSELRALRRQLRSMGDATLWPLLVDLMALDTEKHLRILNFIAGRTGRSGRSGR